MPASHDVFVAFAGPDREFATALAERLLIRGLAVCWKGQLLAEQKFTPALTDFVSSCLVFVVVVSPDTWATQHYAAEELATAVELARADKIAIIPVWTKTIATQDRPDGIKLLTGIALPNHAGCIDCVAGLINEAVLWRKLYEAQQALLRYITASSLPEISPPPRESKPGATPGTVDGLGGLLSARERTSVTEMRPTRRE